METESHGWVGGAKEKGPGGAVSGRGGMRGGRRRREAATEGQAVWREIDALWSATTPRSSAAAENGQAVWPGTGARLFATRSAVGRGGGGEPSSATSVRRGQGGAKQRSRRSQGETDTGGAEHTRGKRPCLNVRQQRRGPGKARRSSATGGSPPPVGWVCRSDRWTAHRGAPPCDLGSCGKYCCFAGSQRNVGWIGAMQGARG
jgi:hypothetical protein